MSRDVFHYLVNRIVECVCDLIIPPYRGYANQLETQTREQTDVQKANKVLRVIHYPINQTDVQLPFFWRKSEMQVSEDKKVISGELNHLTSSSDPSLGD